MLSRRVIVAARPRLFQLSSLPFSSRTSPLLSSSSSAEDAMYYASSKSYPSGLAGEKVLIANRGEIACRVMRTAKKMGMKTVAVHSDVDTMAQHVKKADEAVAVGPAPSIQSYLVIPSIISAMESTGSKFVHPGYGFLSENSLFCAAVDKIGSAFVGPPVEAIEAMGDKIRSKQIAIDAGINTIPGYQGVIVDEDDAVKISRQVGYPVMIKASAGGGGKGMRIAYTDDEAREGFRLSSAEAKSSFNDDRLFVEKYIERPHHIEIQLLADGRKHGNVVCFPERECSIQRRNQKVIEESPSTLLTMETRREMARQAAQLALAVGYASAGTVEFLCDEKQNFYFLEMNTRLQVEHPITEMVTGVDLVQHMLEVAAGHPLPKTLVEAAKNNPHGVVPFKGWAIEGRVYAEDPFRGFLPSTGPLIKYEEPTTESVGMEGVTIRCDSGVVEGSDISMYYDPMISKTVSFGQTRDQAIDGMIAAIDKYVIRGVGHNAPFIASVCRNEAFRKGDTPTSFIPTHYPDGFHGVKLTENETVSLAASVTIIAAARRQYKEEPPLPMSAGSDDLAEHVVVTLGASLPLEQQQHYAVSINSDCSEAIVRSIDGVKLGEAISVEMGEAYCHPSSTIARIDAGGKERVVQVHGESAAGVLQVQMCGATMDVCVRSPQEFKLTKFMKPPPIVDTSNFLLSPMPGKLIKNSVKPGQSVELGQELCVVEAMKMQNVMRSPKKGIVKAVLCKVGDSLKVDQSLVEFEN